MHAAHVETPVPVEYLPAAQPEHGCATAAEYLPPVHGMQTVELSAELMPAEQAAQAEKPVPEEYLPTAQAAQSCAPAEE